jgi:hypothetical protein
MLQFHRHFHDQHGLEYIDHLDYESTEDLPFEFFSIKLCILTASAVSSRLPGFPSVDFILRPFHTNYQSSNSILKDYFYL